MNKQPEVTKATREKLMNAFWEIFSQNGLSKTTVGAITRLAGYNRGTFYQYFKDVYDLLEQLQNEIVEDIEKTLTDKILNNPPQTMTDFSHVCASVMAPYTDKICILSRDNKSSFTSKFKEKFRDHIPVILDVFKNNDDFEFILSYIVSSLLGLINYWYESNKEMSTEKFINMVHILISDGVYGYIKPETIDFLPRMLQYEQKNPNK